MIVLVPKLIDYLPAIFGYVWDNHMSPNRVKTCREPCYRTYLPLGWVVAYVGMYVARSDRVAVAASSFDL